MKTPYKKIVEVVRSYNIGLAVCEMSDEDHEKFPSWLTAKRDSVIKAAMEIEAAGENPLEDLRAAMTRTYNKTQDKAGYPYLRVSDIAFDLLYDLQNFEEKWEWF